MAGGPLRRGAKIRRERAGSVLLQVASRPHAGDLVGAVAPWDFDVKIVLKI